MRTRRLRSWRCMSAWPRSPASALWCSRACRARTSEGMAGHLLALPLPSPQGGFRARAPPADGGGLDLAVLLQNLVDLRAATFAESRVEPTHPLGRLDARYLRSEGGLAAGLPGPVLDRPANQTCDHLDDVSIRHTHDDLRVPVHLPADVVGRHPEGTLSFENAGQPRDVDVRDHGQNPKS